jgi:hypothetical protein
MWVPVGEYVAAHPAACPELLDALGRSLLSPNDDDVAGAVPQTVAVLAEAA